MTPTVDTTLGPLIGLLTLAFALAVYVWVALALSAMFKKMGEEAWKGWVPFLNVATILKWGGFSPWLVLIALVPILGQIGLLVLLIVSAHRINPGFGYGTGMTVLSALVWVVWASILGFGPAPWTGARTTVSPSIPQPQPSGPYPPAPPAPGPSTPTMVGPVGALPVPGPLAAPPAAPAPVPGSAYPAAPAVPPRPAMPAAAAAAAPPSEQASWAPPTPPVTTPPVRPRPEPSVEAWPSEIDDVSAVYPSPYPPSAAKPAVHAAPPPLKYDPSSSDALISSVPGRRSTAVPPDVPVADEPVAAPEIPAPPAPVAAEIPAPPTIPDPVVNVPAPEDATPPTPTPERGTPLSALSSVSAQQRQSGDAQVPPVAEALDLDEDDVDQTVMVRRKKVSWQLVSATGVTTAITADVVVLGRRPLAQAEHPSAQLVSVDDTARTVSKTHALLRLAGERWEITDLGSTNGVLLRTLMGEEIEVEPGTALDAGERFFLGDEEFHLVQD